MPERVKIVPQGRLVAESLADYLDRHPGMAELCSKEGHTEFLTTEATDKFDRLASIFLDSEVNSTRITLQ